MADAAPASAPTRGGFGGRGRGGDRGRGGRGRGRRGPRKDEEKEWVPVTKLGRLVRAGKIKSMEVTFSLSSLTLGNLLAFIARQRVSNRRLFPPQTHG
jgi:small subunit ribosomal protein S2e